MRDTARIDPLIEKLRKTWHKYPDMRLGQLIENARSLGADTDEPEYRRPSTWEVEEPQIDRGLDRL